MAFKVMEYEFSYYPYIYVNNVHKRIILTNL